MAKYLFFFLLAFALLPTKIVFAGEFDTNYRNIRSSSMGNTGISSANDIYSLDFNPATLANIHTVLVDLIATELSYNEFGKDFVEILGDGYSSRDDEFVQSDEAIKYRDLALRLLQEKTSEQLYAYNSYHAGIAWNFHPNGFTGGVRAMQVFDIRANVTSDGSGDISTDLNYTQDTVLDVGASVPLFKGVLVFGLGYKFVNRNVLATSFSTTDLINGLSTNVKTGSDVNKNTYSFGMMLRIPGPLRLRMAYAYRNIGGMDFDTGRDIYEEHAVGISMVPIVAFPYYFGGIRLSLMADYRDLTDEDKVVDDTDNLRKLNLGMELGFFPKKMTTPYLSFRAGYSEMSYPSYGVEFNLGNGRNLILGAAQYSANLGTVADPVESKRTSFYLSFGF